MVFVYATFKDEAEAKNIARALLDKHLIACANLIPIRSVFRWEGKIADEEETAMLMKTREEKFGEIQRVIESMHSYKIPSISLIEADSNEAFAKWVRQELR